MLELAHRTFETELRRRAITDAIEALRSVPHEGADISDTALADALAVNAEFDALSVKEATEVAEAALARTAVDRPPAVRMVPSWQHHANLEAVRRWAYCRYVYAEVAGVRRAIEPEFDVSRAISEIADAEAYTSEWGRSGERPSDSELYGDLRVLAGPLGRGHRRVQSSCRGPVPVCPARL